jgi:hypothetical protein
MVMRESFNSLINSEIPLHKDISTLGILSNMISETVDAGIVTNRKHG